MNTDEKFNPEEYLQRNPGMAQTLKTLFNGVSELCGDCALIDRCIGDFRILRLIGEGGMGKVFEAEQVSLRKRVALKILAQRSDLSESAIRKFKREAEAGGRQRHPGIVSTLAVGEEGGLHYIAQELVEGGLTLADRLEKLRKSAELPRGYFREVAKLVSQVADALRHAHRSGVIHRDVKPANVLITREGKPKISDFGLAKVENALLISRTGDFIGTPYYMSPEQALGNGGKIDQRTDIFSLGVMLYEMLTLQHPFGGKTSYEVMKKIVLHEPPDPRKRNPRVPQDLAIICLKAVEKRPDNRYASMADMKEDLDRFLQGETILARPAGMGTKALRKMKRNPTASTAACAALLGAVVFVLYALWSYPKILAERDRAIQAEQEAERQQRAAVAALRRAERERERAETEEINARTASNFLGYILRSANPYNRGRDIKVSEVLDAAVKELADGFEGPLEVEASLRRTIGTTYHGLGLLDRAESQLTRALEIYRDVLGDEHQVTLATLHDLALTIGSLGRSMEAELLTRRVLASLIPRYGLEHPRTASALMNLAVIYWRQGKDTLAEEGMRKALEIRRRTLEEDHPDTLHSMSSLSSLLSDLGEYEEAEELIREVFEKQRRLSGGEHPDTLGTQSSLITLLARQGRFDEAKEEAERNLEIERRVFGGDHPGTLGSMNSYADVLIKMGLVSRAAEVQKDSMETCLRVLGERHPTTLIAMDQMAQVLRLKGQYAESESLHRRVLAVRRDVLGNGNEDTISSLNSLANVLVQQNKFVEAEEVMREALLLQKRIRGKEHPNTLAFMANLAVTLLRQGRSSEAEPLFREAVEIAQRVLPEGHVNIAIFQINYGRCLVLSKQYGEAEKQLLLGFDGLKAVLGEDNYRTRAAMRELAKMYDAWGKTEKAEEFRSMMTSKEN